MRGLAKKENMGWGKKERGVAVGLRRRAVGGGRNWGFVLYSLITVGS